MKIIKLRKSKPNLHHKTKKSTRKKIDYGLSQSTNIEQFCAMTLTFKCQNSVARTSSQNKKILVVINAKHESQAQNCISSQSIYYRRQCFKSLPSLEKESSRDGNWSHSSEYHRRQSRECASETGAVASVTIPTGKHTFREVGATSSKN